MIPKIQLDRLASLRVADVMSREVVSVEAHNTMAKAARVLLENHVSGAPTIDEQGRCVGVLSATDFVRREVVRSGTERDVSGSIEHLVEGSAKENPVEIEEVDDEIVAANMSTAVQAIAADMLVLQAAREMCVGHVHRLPVLDEHGRPQGVISSLDIVAALLNAIDEDRAAAAG